MSGITLNVSERQLIVEALLCYDSESLTIALDDLIGLCAKLEALPYLEKICPHMTEDIHIWRSKSHRPRENP